MKYINAGISKKSGKPYSAFYSCNVCKQTAKAETHIDKFAQSLDQDLEDDKWKKINAEKNDNISWLNAKRCAANLLAGQKFDPIEFAEVVRQIYLINN
jgi:hypothetical protein